MKILIYETSLNLLKAYESLVKRIFNDVEIITIHRLEDAHQLLIKNNFDFVFLSLRSGGIDEQLCFSEVIHKKIHKDSFMLITGAHELIRTLQSIHHNSTRHLYLSLPFKETELIQKLENIFFALHVIDQTPLFTYSNSHIHLKIPENEICFFEINYKICTVNTLSNKYYLNRYSLKSIVQETSPSFIQIHRSFVVNKNFIRKIELTDNNWFCHLQNHEYPLPIGKKYLEEVRKIF